MIILPCDQSLQRGQYLLHLIILKQSLKTNLILIPLMSQMTQVPCDRKLDFAIMTEASTLIFA